MTQNYWRTAAVVIVASILLSFPPSLLAAGFALYEMSARGNAMGGAMTAKADDPSAVYYNPAGITQLPGTQFSFGTSIVNPSFNIKTKGGIDFTVAKDLLFLAGRWQYVLKKPCVKGMDETTSSSKEQSFVLPNTYITYQFNDRLWLGVGAFSRFGLGIDYPENWAGRFNSYSSNVRTAEVNPNLAYKLSDKFSIAAGLSFMYMDVSLKSKFPGMMVPTVAASHRRNVEDKVMLDLGMPNEIDKQIRGDALGYGFNLGVNYRYSPFISFGATYRSKVKQEVSGEISFDNLQGNEYGHQGLYIPSKAGVSGEIILPSQLTFGISVKPLKQLSLEMDLYYTGWSSYNALFFSFDKSILNMTSHSIPKNWNDVFSFRFGAEYNVTDWADLRLGYVYDQSPVPDVTFDYALPDSDRNIFNAGIGLHNGNWLCDLSFSYLMMKKRHVGSRAVPDMVLDSEVSGSASICSLEFGYKF